jgi:hypothetical protein
MVTPAVDVAIRPRMGRRLRWPERVGAKFAEGTLERIAGVLRQKEVRLDFIREAVEREIARREKRAGRKERRS